MILRTAVIALLFVIGLSGCSTTKPVVWKAQDVSFAGFESFEIQPVFNAKNLPVNQDILSLLTFYLKEEFRSKNLQLNDDPQAKTGVLIVQSDLVEFDDNKAVDAYQYSLSLGSGVYRKSKCTLSTRLIDKSTSRVVAKISTVKEVGVKTLGTGKEWVLKESAAAVANQVVSIMQ